jgi:alpha-methylacyl-CoA racemase
MATLEEALADEHFVKRGLFTEQVASSAGEKTLPALPVPISPEFRVEGARTYPRVK